MSFTILLVFLLGMLFSTSANYTSTVQVGIALRSESIVLVQLAEQKTINYSLIYPTDQSYRDFMTMMRRSQTNSQFLEEWKLLWSGIPPIYGKSSNPLDHPMTNLHYTHVLARNLREVVRRASSELGRPVKCEGMITPDLGRARYDIVQQVRLAAELAGTCSIDISQLGYLHTAVHYGYELDLIEGQRWKAHPDLSRSRMSLVVEIEPKHVRIGAYDFMPRYVSAHCARSCEARNASSVELLTGCATTFIRDCLIDKQHSKLGVDRGRVQVQALREIFVSGTLSFTQQEAVEVLQKNFGEALVTNLTFAIDPELIGAYGIAYRTQLAQGLSYMRTSYWGQPWLVE